MESFLSGILSGVGFAFVEALFLTPTGADWAETMFTRGGATMMHAFTAGMTCWGIGQAVTYKNWRRFVGGFALAILMHGVWNAAALGIGIGAIPGEYGEAAISASVARSFIIMGIMVLVGLSFSALAGIIIIPERLSKDEDIAITESPPDVEVPPASLPDEELQTNNETPSEEKKAMDSST
jgi:hypothetical protein